MNSCPVGAGVGAGAGSSAVTRIASATAMMAMASIAHIVNVIFRRKFMTNTPSQLSRIRPWPARGSTYIWLVSSLCYFLDVIEDNPGNRAGGMGCNPTVRDEGKSEIRISKFETNGNEIRKGELME